MSSKILIAFFCVCTLSMFAQPSPKINPVLNHFDNPYPEANININQLRWLPNSHDFWVLEKQGSEKAVMLYNADDLNNGKSLLTETQMKAAGLKTKIESIVWSEDRKNILIYTNSSRVWRINSKGDYWFFDLATGKGKQVGAGLKESELKFAKFSPDAKQVAYVYLHNLYVEELATSKRKQLTMDGTSRIINGTFDWVYEEELGCRDGFRWSPDSKQIAYWHTDASMTKNHLMINNTDSLYPFTTAVEYPKVGEKPSAVKIGVCNLATGKTNWLKIPGGEQENYLVRMDWAGNANELMVAQLNRAQNLCNMFLCNAQTGVANKVYSESDPAWIDITKAFVYDEPNWKWIEGGKSFLWNNDTEAWMRIYKISRDGKSKTLLTKGDYDADMQSFDVNTGNIYFYAAPYDATQKYLYRISMNGGDTVRVTPAQFDGTNDYRFSQDGKYATHIHRNINTFYNFRLVQLPTHNKTYPSRADNFKKPENPYTLQKFKVITVDNVSMDGIAAYPLNFDSTKKYPIIFYAYGEPAATTANDEPRFDDLVAQMIPEGYVAVTMDNRGTPAMKGREWRKSLFRKIGVLNTRDQAMAAKEVFKWKYIDTSRVAIHGWSGGGAMTLNCLFRYPEVYKTGIAVSAISNAFLYDNIYQERYMGQPQETMADYEKMSPKNFAQNLRGNLLYIHGTGDDNVHYQNAEQLIDELVKNKKQFQLMIYPNRTHGISEGEGTSEHMAQLFFDYMIKNCPPGGR